MKFQKIVGFGDSWMYGDELMDPEYAAQHPEGHYSDEQNFSYRLRHCFLGQLGEHYDVPTENFGIPGGSLGSTMWTFQWWLDHETRKPEPPAVAQQRALSWRSVIVTMMLLKEAWI